MVEKLRTGSTNLRWLRRFILVAATTAAIAAPIDGNFINSFRLKYAMAEPHILVARASAVEAAETFYSLLGKMAVAKPDELPGLRGQASGIVQTWKSKKEFVDLVSAKSSNLIIGILRYGDPSSQKQFSYLWELLEKTPVSQPLKEKLKEFTGKQIFDPAGQFNSLYKDYKESPLYKSDDQASGFNFTKFLLSGYSLRVAEEALTAVSQGKTDQAQKLLDANKNERFNTALAWKMAEAAEIVVAKGDRNQAKMIGVLLGMQSDNALARQFKEVFQLVFTNEKSKYSDLYSAYLTYATDNKMEPSLGSFLATICDVHDAINNSKYSTYPSLLVMSVTNLSLLKPSKTNMKAELKLAEAEEENVDRALKASTRRLKDIGEPLAMLEEFVKDYIKDPAAKSRLNLSIDKWKRNLAAAEKQVDLAKQVIKKKKFSAEEIQFLKRVQDLPTSLEKLQEGEIPQKVEVKIVKQLAMNFISALMTGSQQAVDKFNESYQAFSTMKGIGKERKYGFLMDTVGSFLQDLSPQVYSITKVPDVLEAMKSVHAAENQGEKRTLDQLRVNYGSVFVNYVLANDDALSTLFDAATPKMTQKHADLIATAKNLLFAQPEMIDTIAKICDAIGTKNQKALEDYEDNYGKGFVANIAKNYDAITGLLSKADTNLEKFAEKFPALMQALTESSIPVQQEQMINSMQGMIRHAGIFRANMDKAFSENEKSFAQQQVQLALKGYRTHFGSDTRVLALFYDIDSLAGKKVRTFDEVYSTFDNVVSTVFDEKQYLSMIDATKTMNLLSKYYFIQASKLASAYNLEPTFALPAMADAINTMAVTDQYLLPAYFEHVIRPLAKMVKGDTRAFTEALFEFDALVTNRYPAALNAVSGTELSYLTNVMRERFTAVFNYFENHMPEIAKAITHFELEAETRSRGEMTSREAIPPYDLYGLNRSVWEQMNAPRLTPGLFGRPPTDIIPSPSVQWPATMPAAGGQQGLLSANGEATFLKLDLVTNPMIPAITRPAAPNAFRIGIVSRQRLLMSIREAFGNISAYSPEDLIAHYEQVGGFYLLEGSESGKGATKKDVTRETAGVAGDLTMRYPMGGLVDALTYTQDSTTTVTGEGKTAKTEESSSKTLQQSSAGGGIGHVISLKETLNYNESQQPDEKKKFQLRGDLDTLFSMSKQDGSSLLIYVPEFYLDDTGRETEVGKLYYTAKDGSVYQVAAGKDTVDIVKNFLYGSAETKDVIASIRKYEPKTWNDDRALKTFGGAAGFTLDPIAVFAMEDAIRRARFTTAGTVDQQTGKVAVDQITGLQVKTADFTNLEAVGIAAVPISFAINGAIKNGTVAFVSRLAAPTTAITTPGTENVVWKNGVYSGEVIIRKVEPEKEWELRLMAGYPGQGGILYKEAEHKGSRVNRLFTKASTTSSLLWSNLMVQEQESKQVASYMRTAMAELYKWSEDQATQSGYFYGASLMFSALDQDKKYFEGFGEGKMWDKTFFSAIAGYYAQKFSVFSSIERAPAYAQDTLQLIDQSMSIMRTQPERAGNVADELSKQLEAMTTSKIWRSVTGLSWDPEKATVRFTLSAEVREPQEYGYSMLGGALFVGYKGGIQPYGESQLYTYAWPVANSQQQFARMQAYMDLYESIGAANIQISPHSEFYFEAKQLPLTTNKMLEFLQDNREDIINELFTKYYPLTGKMPEVDFVPAANLALNRENPENRYYLMIDNKKNTAYLGNEKDRQKWVEAGLELYADIFVVSAVPEKKSVLIETTSVKTSLIANRLRLLGGQTFKLEPETGNAGWTAGLFADVYKDHKKQFLFGSFGAKREIGDEDWMQYAATASMKWNMLDWTTMHDRVYGYLFTNNITKEMRVVPVGEFNETTQKLTVGAGWTWAFFDGVLGNTSKFDFYAEGGFANVSYDNGVAKTNPLDKKILPFNMPENLQSRDDFIYRVGLGYSRRNMFYMDWFSAQIVTYRGWWPMGDPANITQPWVLKDQSTLWQLERSLKAPYGLMFTLGGQY